MKLQINKYFELYFNSHSSKDCFLYNNNLLVSNLISLKEYNINREFIIKNRKNETTNK